MWRVTVAVAVAMVCACKDDNATPWSLNMGSCTLANNATVADEGGASGPLAPWNACRADWSGDPDDILTAELTGPNTLPMWFSISSAGEPNTDLTIIDPGGPFGSDTPPTTFSDPSHQIWLSLSVGIGGSFVGKVALRTNQIDRQGIDVSLGFGGLEYFHDFVHKTFGGTIEITSSAPPGPPISQ